MADEAYLTDVQAVASALRAAGGLHNEADAETLARAAIDAYVEWTVGPDDPAGVFDSGLSRIIHDWRTGAGSVSGGGVGVCGSDWWVSNARQ